MAQTTANFIIYCENEYGDTGSEFCYGTLSESKEKLSKLNEQDDDFYYWITDINGNNVPSL